MVGQLLVCLVLYSDTCLFGLLYSYLLNSAIIMVKKADFEIQLPPLELFTEKYIGAIHGGVTMFLIERTLQFMCIVLLQYQ